VNRNGRLLYSSIMSDFTNYVHGVSLYLTLSLASSGLYVSVVSEDARRFGLWDPKGKISSNKWSQSVQTIISPHPTPKWRSTRPVTGPAIPNQGTKAGPAVPGLPFSTVGSSTQPVTGPAIPNQGTKAGPAVLGSAFCSGLQGFLPGLEPSTISETFVNRRTPFCAAPIGSLVPLEEACTTSCQ